MFQQTYFNINPTTEPFEENFHRFYPGQSFQNSAGGLGLAANAEQTELQCLNLETLESFEVINEQFEKLGLTFNNAIALKPSNPAFPTYSGQMLLLAAPDNGCIEITFSEPVSYVSGRVTSSRPTILTAYNSLGQEVVRKKLLTANLAGSNSPIPPNELLFAEARNIHKVTFYAFDGQLTLDAISFQK